MSGAETHRRSQGWQETVMVEEQSIRDEAGSERNCGHYGRENAGMSSEMEVGILQAEYPRFPG